MVGAQHIQLRGFQNFRNCAGNPTCNLTKRSAMATVLETCKFIIQDLCIMAHKKALDALDRTLRDFRDNEKLMGRNLILLAGDFRQTLPVVPRLTLMSSILA